MVRTIVQNSPSEGLLTLSLSAEKDSKNGYLI